MRNTEDLFAYADRRPTAMERGIEGAQHALGTADIVEEGWSDRAVRKVQEYARDHAEFMAEDVRTWAHEQGLAPPPDPRAWGGVMLRCVRMGLLTKGDLRMTSVPPAHASPRRVWRRAA